MPSLVATTSTPARKPFVRTHYVRTNMAFRQHVLSIKTLTIIFNLSVLFFLNFKCIIIVKVSGMSNRLPESSNDTINTLRLKWNTLHAKIRYVMNVSHFNPLSLSCDFSYSIRIVSEIHRQTERWSTSWRFSLRRSGGSNKINFWSAYPKIRLPLKLWILTITMITLITDQNGWP